MLEWFIFRWIVNKTDLREEYKHMFSWRKAYCKSLCKNWFFLCKLHIIRKIRSTFLLTNFKKPLHLIWKLLGFSLGLVFGNGVCCVFFNSDERFHVQTNPQWLAKDLGIDMLIVCNCCICNCWNCLQDNVMRYGISSYWWSRQESGYLEVLLSALGRPLHPSNRRTLTKRVPTSFWYSSVSEKWEIVTLQKNNQNIPTTGWNLRHLKAYKS